MTAPATASSKSRGFDPHSTARMESLAGVPLASFGARAFAFLIDLVLALVVFLVVVVGGKVLWALHAHLERVDAEFDFHNIYSIVVLILYFGISLYLGNGKTIGKRIMGIRVVSLAHPHITLWQSIERALGYGASALEAGFGFLQYFIHPNHCCVHDRIAETIVVNDK